MIRFRTIDPAEAEKATAQPAPLVLRAAAPPQERAAEASRDAAEDKPKHLARKAPLRARKPETAPLFDK
jgi:hypothetical protein